MFQFYEWNNSECSIWILEACVPRLPERLDLKTADPRNSTCLGTNRITAWPTGYNVPLAYDLWPESPSQDIGLRMPAENTRLGFNETHIFWRMDEKFAVDSCTSCAHLQFRPRPDFGVGERFSGLRTRGTHVLSPRHVLGLGTIRSGAAAQRNRPQHLRWQRRSVWWRERALQHVCSLHALRNA